MVGRGEHSEIVTFVGKTVDSELSGNMIDLCPVGALTSKPFRYAARTWELVAAQVVSPHDGLGSNLDRAGEERSRDARAAARERGGQRVLAVRQGPLLATRRSTREERLTRADGQAERRVARGRLADRARLRRARPDATSPTRHGADAIGALASPHSTLEELHSPRKLVRGLGSDNIDFRLRQTRFPRRRPARGHPVARHADRRRRQARPRARRSAASCARTSRCSRSACARRRRRARRSRCCTRSTTTG